MAVLGNSFNAGNTNDQTVDDSSSSGIDWTGVISSLGTSASQIVSQVTQPAPFTQLPNGTVVTAAGQVVPGTNPSSISGSTLLIVFVLAALVFFIRK